MKKIIYLLLLSIFFGCTAENDLIDLSNAEAPSKLDALFKIKQDNSGFVTITPTGEGVTQYEIFHGDTANLSVKIKPGESTTHTYTEGVYPVKIVGMGVNGVKTEMIKQLTVSFLQPTNLVVTVNPLLGNNLGIKVNATANLETYFQVFFGENPNQVPVNFNEGDVIQHIYATVGTYQLRVRALSGGAAFAENIQTITISDPVLLPVNFESPTLNYSFVNFGGSVTTVINNPDITAANNSAKVARMVKGNGSETWAGSFIELSNPINFTTFQKLKIKSWSPAVGKTIRMKIENSTNPAVFLELDKTTTVANAWEELIFDFTGVVSSNNYQKIVLFYDFGNAGTGSTYYFDNIELTAGVPVLELPLNFENSQLNYSFTNFGNATTTVIANPNSNGINTSSKVGSLVKANGSPNWAGSFIELNAPINFSSMQKIKMKVWSPQSGIIAKMKLENLANANINIERDATVTLANGWQEVTFDFTGIVNANAYQRVVVFFDFANAGTGATYYFDDITQSN
jgi:hypothetical protein